MPGTKTVRLILHAEKFIDVDAEEFADAQKNDDLVDFMDQYVADMEPDAVVVEADGTLTELRARALVRRSLLYRNVTNAIAAIVDGVRPQRDCEMCDQESRLGCARHISMRLAEAVRVEGLIIMPAKDADAVVKEMVEEMVAANLRAAGR